MPIGKTEDKHIVYDGLRINHLRPILSLGGNDAGAAGAAGAACGGSSECWVQANVISASNGAGVASNATIELGDEVEVADG